MDKRPYDTFTEAGGPKDIVSGEGVEKGPHNSVSLTARGQKLKQLERALIAHFSLTQFLKSGHAEHSGNETVQQEAMGPLASKDPHSRALFLDVRAAELKALIEYLHSQDKAVQAQVGVLAVRGHRPNNGSMEDQFITPGRHLTLVSGKITDPYSQDDIASAYNHSVVYYQTADGLEISATQLGAALIDGSLTIVDRPEFTEQG